MGIVREELWSQSDTKGKENNYPASQSSDTRSVEEKPHHLSVFQGREGPWRARVQLEQ